jgi:DNA-binding response OmpR family regulator
MADLPRATRPKVLTIDDSPLVGRMIGEVLQDQPVDVFVAENGEEGLALARREKPDLILLDLEMPRLSGMTVCRMLRAFPETAGSIIYILSSHGAAPSSDELASLRVSGCLTKPFSPADLHDLIRAEFALNDT